MRETVQYLLEERDRGAGVFIDGVRLEERVSTFHELLGRHLICLAWEEWPGLDNEIKFRIDFASMDSDGELLYKEQLPLW